MAESAARLLALLSLLQSRPSWTGGELAERLEVTGRTLRRDVERLRGLGYPVHAERGPIGGYRLGPGARLPPLLLGDDEALATAVALRAVACGEVGSLAESVGSALAKLEQVMPDRLRQQISAVHQVAVALPRAVDTGEPATFSALALACHRSHRVRFDYTDHHARASARHVEPFRLVHSGRYWYLVARDLDREAWRVFRVDRIGDVLDTGARFVVSEPPDATQLVAEAVALGPYAHQARVLLHADVERATADFPPTVGILEPVDAGTCLLTVGSRSMDAIVMHLGTAEYEFTVLAPAELQARVEELAARFERAARRHRDQDRRRRVVHEPPKVTRPAS